MKKLLITLMGALIAVQVYAGPAKVEALKLEKAKAIMAQRDNKETKDYFSNIAKAVSSAGKLEGLSLNIEKALSHGNADLLVTVTKIAADNNTKAAKMITELSAGVKSEKDAADLAALVNKNLDSIPGAEGFINKMYSAIEKGESVAQAKVTAAKQHLEETKSKEKLEDWLKKLEDCV